MFEVIPCAGLHVREREPRHELRGAGHCLRHPRRRRTSIGVTTTFFGEPSTNHNINNRSVATAPLAFLAEPGGLRGGSVAGAGQHRFVAASGELSAGRLAEPRAIPNWKTIDDDDVPVDDGLRHAAVRPVDHADAGNDDRRMSRRVDGRSACAAGPNSSPELATPELKNATVTLPEGMSVSPSAADGLAGLQRCADRVRIDRTRDVPGRVGAGDGEDPYAVVGRPAGRHRCSSGRRTAIRVRTPMRPMATCCGLFIEAAGDGVRIKKEGRIYANPSTGQLTTKFEENPELPVRRSRTDVQGWAARRARDATELRHGDDDDRFGAVEHADHAGLQPDVRVQRGLEREWRRVSGGRAVRPVVQRGDLESERGAVQPVDVDVRSRRPRTGSRGYPGADAAGVVGVVDGCPAVRGAAGVARDVRGSVADRHDDGRGGPGLAPVL